MVIHMAIENYTQGSNNGAEELKDLAQDPG